MEVQQFIAVSNDYHVRSYTCSSEIGLESQSTITSHLEALERSVGNWELCHLY